MASERTRDLVNPGDLRPPVPRQQIELTSPENLLDLRRTVRCRRRTLQETGRPRRGSSPARLTEGGTRLVELTRLRHLPGAFVVKVRISGVCVKITPHTNPDVTADGGDAEEVTGVGPEVGW
jgi:hypothetical protein